MDSTLVSDNIIPKLDTIARIGINLGQSSRPTRSVSLIFNLLMGLVLPQFHVKHDEFFETAAPRTGNPEVASHWQGVSALCTLLQLSKS
jgi:hypothetical protein